ncbi:hypothetical protein F5B17DRAFT_418182 [Nemania serpens]|nr:hypothetical protein F5B17DRAFT_418182 [Nemania serpens]
MLLSFAFVCVSLLAFINFVYHHLFYYFTYSLLPPCAFIVEIDLGGTCIKQVHSRHGEVLAATRQKNAESLAARVEGVLRHRECHGEVARDLALRKPQFIQGIPMT